MPEDEELTPMEARFAERIGETLRRPEALRRQFDADVMAEVRRMSGSRTGAWHWLQRPRIIRVSPLSVFGSVAALLFLAFVPWLRGPRPPPSNVVRADQVQPVQFVFYAPDASSVALVGDFNDWDRAATPLARADGGGVWSVAVPLSPGRHQYAFVVNGKWTPDPEAARAIADDFGEPNSVVTVAGRS